jgi:hypothetical protein
MIRENYLKDARRQLHSLKQLADKAVAQVSDEALFAALDSETNSIAVTMKHLAGNMRSRWTDFLTADGEKPDRNRDSEFVIEDEGTRERILSVWEAGWRCLFDAVEPLEPADLERTVLIRGEPHTVIEAINRQISHYAYHIGQIVLLARHHCGDRWRSLSIPRGQSEAFNQRMRRKQGGA